MIHQTPDKERFVPKSDSIGIDDVVSYEILHAARPPFEVVVDIEWHNLNIIPIGVRSPVITSAGNSISAAILFGKAKRLEALI